MMSNLQLSDGSNSLGASNSVKENSDSYFDKTDNTGVCNRTKCHSVTTSYYESSEVNNSLPSEPTIQKTKQSQRLPRWVSFLLSKSLGIPLHANDRPILGTILHVFTFASALSYVASEIWYCVYDIICPNTKQDILKGSVVIVITIMWTSIGLYAKSLNRRLFQHPRFLADVRMHSRTVFKISAALLVFLLGLIFVSINDFQAVSLLKDETCLNIELNPIVCKINFVARVVFSIFALLWNTLVAIVLISVCRTHTIGIRRFIRELEHDALMYDHYHCQLYHGSPMTKEDVCEETFWLEDDSSVDDGERNNFVVIHRNIAKRNSEDIQQTLSASHLLQENGGENITSADGQLNIIFSPYFKPNYDDSFSTKNLIEKQSPNEFIPVDMIPGKEDSSVDDTADKISVTAHTMSTAEILHKHWKISCRLRLSSCALQRWIASLSALVIIWCFVFLIRWQDHPPGVDDILQFVIPLLLLPLLCSAYAEVNMEGVRMIKCVCPIEDRLSVIRFLGQNPLQMTIFGYGVSYGTIMTIVFAIFVAFTSRLIFAEMQQNNS